MHGYADDYSDGNRIDGAEIDEEFVFILGFYLCLSMVKLNT